MPLPFTLATLVSAVAVSSAGTAAANTAPQHYVRPVTESKQTVATVKPGDSLSKIAKSYSTTFVRLFDANTKIKDPDLIYPGDKIRIPDANEKLPNRPLPANAPIDAIPPVSATAQASVSQPAVRQAPQPKPAVAAKVTVRALQSAPVSGCGDNSYAHFIYSHESGCRTTAMSPNGCYGIGQACPASKIGYCGANYACQNAYFTQYAGKYGGWAGAYAFWVSHGWW